MNKNVNQYLGEEKISKLMLKFCVPCILSLLIASLYNVVDQIFIGNGVGYLGNGATNVVFPITIIAFAVTLMIGDGCAAFLSICQGRGDHDGSHRCVGNGITLIVVAGIVLTAVFAVFEEQILWAFGATESNIEYAREYFDYIIIGIPFYMFGNAIIGIIRADGDPKFAMIATFAGCIANVILDPVAIFVLHWGMMGAAVATVIGQIITAAMALYYLFHTKSFKLNKSSFAPKAAIICRIVPMGGSSFLTQLSIVAIMAAMNNTLVTYGAMSKFGADIPLTVVGIVMKVFQIVISICVGVTAGSQPIIGYNYGAGKLDRVKENFAKIMRVELCIGVIGLLSFELLPLQIISIFGSGDALYQEFAVLTFRIYLCTIVLACIQKACCIFLQALGKSVLSTGLSLLRDFVLCLPLILLLPVKFGIHGVLFSAPIADAIAFTVTAIIMARQLKKMSIIQEHELNLAPMADSMA